jgi:hypothetical protein
MVEIHHPPSLGVRGEASREGHRGRLHYAAGVGLIINSNLSLIFKNHRGRQTPTPSYSLAPARCAPSVTPELIAVLRPLG